MSPPTVLLTVRTSPAVVSELDALAARLPAGGAIGGRMTRTAAARLALERGLLALQREPVAADPGPVADPRAGWAALPDPGTVGDAAEALERLAELDLWRIDEDALKALGALDIDVLRVLRRLDRDVIEAPSDLDLGGFAVLDRLDEVADRLQDLVGRLEQRSYTPVYNRALAEELEGG